MEARKLVVQVAAICPFALVLGMGATVRHPVAAHTTLEYSEAQNERVEAYSSVMAMANQVVKAGPAVDRYADVWIQLGRQTKLQALTPAFQEDIEEDNPRSQIIQTWELLLERLNTSIQRNVRAHKAEVVVKEVTRALRLGEILKYSDFDTLYVANTSATRALEDIGSMAADASPKAQKDLSDALATIHKNRGKLPEMYKVLKTNYEDYVFRRIGVDQQLGDDTPKVPTEGGVSEDGEITTTAQQIQHRFVVAIRTEVRIMAAGRSALAVPTKSAKL